MSDALIKAVKTFQSSGQILPHDRKPLNNRFPLTFSHSLNRNNHQFSVSLPNNSLLKLTLDVNLLHANTIGPGHNIHVI